MGLKDIFGKVFGGGAASADPEVERLIARLSDPDAKARLQAARELGRLGGRARPASAKLLELIDDDDGDVCNAAADALSQIERGL